MIKHPPVPGVDLETLRRVFDRNRKAGSRLLLADAIEVLKAPAPEADAVLRKAAEVGYIEWKCDNGDDKDWELTAAGLRLVADSLGPSLTRKEVDDILETVLARARRINGDPARIVRVSEILLFGSVLDPTRDAYGDVDVVVNVVPRRTPAEEVEVARSAIAEVVPASWRKHSILQYNPEVWWDSQRARTQLKGRLSGLSMSQEAILSLGCEYRTIYAFDLDTETELTPSNEIVPRTSPPLTVAPCPIPATTVIVPVGLLSPDESLLSDGISISMRDLSLNEAKAWLGDLDPAGGPRRSLDSRRTPALRFAGAQHLFDEWKDPRLSGLELFQRTLDWGAVHDVPIASQSRGFTLRTNDRTRIANFHGLMVQRIADRIDAYLTPRSFEDALEGRSRNSSPRTVAVNHSLAVAFGRMLDETRLTGQITFAARFNLDGIRRNQYPALPDLLETGRIIQRRLRDVEMPTEVIEASRERSEGFMRLDLNREADIHAVLSGDRHQQHVVSYVTTCFGSEDWEPEMILDEDGDRRPVLLPGEAKLLDALEALAERLEASVSDLPGCREMSVGGKAPYPAC